MDQAQLDAFETCSVDDATHILHNFNQQHVQSFEFPELTKGSQCRRRLWTAIFSRLKDPKSSICHRHCLEAIRILSRDKSELNELICSDWLDVLLQQAGLVSEEEAISRVNQQIDFPDEVLVEAQKCLCNLVFNSPVAQALCAKNGAVPGIMLRLKTYRDPDLAPGVKFFDMKMLFLITALCPEVRPRLKNEQHGLTYLMEVLDLVVKEAQDDFQDGCFHRDDEDNAMAVEGQPMLGGQTVLTDEQVELTCEVLKVLFNLTVRSDRRAQDEEEEAHFLRLVAILHELISAGTTSQSKREDLLNHSTNLLTNVPRKCLEELIPPARTRNHHQGDANGVQKEAEYDGFNVQALINLLGFLDSRLKKLPSPSTLKETLIPILGVLSESARQHRAARKFMRVKVLPPLTDVMSRPEEGNTLRNRLCRILTTPVTEVRDLAADFLFVLCKENVGRMVKYTGYGNAAGLLANRGLLLGGRGQGNYSSDSEDSDTEEYKKYRHKINPVLGCYEPPRPNPMEGLTEEQKEYEAMQLVNMMDKLAKKWDRGSVKFTMSQPLIGYKRMRSRRTEQNQK